MVALLQILFTPSSFYKNAHAGSKLRPYLKKSLQVVASAALLATLGLLVNWPDVLRSIAAANPIWLALAAFAILLARCAITWRWKALLDFSDNRISWQRLFGIVSAGIGVGSLLPTSVGPDVMRGAMLAQQNRRIAGQARVGNVVTSLLLDRIVSVFATLLVALGATTATSLWQIAIPLAGVLTAGLSVIAFVLLKGQSTLERNNPSWLRPIAMRLSEALLQINRPEFVWRALLPSLMASILMTLARTMVFIFLYRALGYAVPLSHALVLIPLLMIALIFPFSVGGLGIREWVLIVGFEGIGIPPEASISVGLMSFGLQFLVSTPWFVTFALRRDTRASAQAAIVEAELP